MILIVLFFWFAFTFVVAVAANTRGRSAIGWWILAVIFSPLVAGLFLLAMRNLRMERLLVDPVVLAEDTKRRLKRRHAIAVAIIVPFIFIISVSIIMRTIDEYRSKSAVSAQPAQPLSDASRATLAEIRESQKATTPPPATNVDTSFKPGTEKPSLTTSPTVAKPPKPAAAALATAANATNEHSQKLLNMTEKDRNTTWTLLLQKSGEKCDRVVRTMFQGSSRHDDSWNVACQNGKSYSVGVYPGPEGKTQILGCKELEFVTKGTARCWVKF